jgi:hypothetical protein
MSAMIVIRMGIWYVGVLIVWIILCIHPAEYEEHFESLTIKCKEILNHAKALAKLIQAHYQGLWPIMLCVLKGARP